MMKLEKMLWSSALALLMMAGASFAQTADLDKQQQSLDALNGQLESAQRTQLEHARADQLNRESFAELSSEISEQVLEANIARLRAQIVLEDQRSVRQADELKKIADLQAQVADASKKLHDARVAEFNKQITTQRSQLEAIHKARIAALNAQEAAEQKELDALQATAAGAPAAAPAAPAAPAPAPARGR
jgi:chromosome segregation ATPase